jgi:hypothetical protein
MNSPTKPRICPLCGSAYTKALYAGIPVKLCLNNECSLMWGFFSIIVTWLPFNGMFFVYEGNYFKALWCWLFMKEET